MIFVEMSDDSGAVALPPCLSPLITAETQQERLLALGRLIHQCPKMPSELRLFVTNWINTHIDVRYVRLSHVFAEASDAFILDALMKEIPLQKIAELLHYESPDDQSNNV